MIATFGCKRSSVTTSVQNAAPPPTDGLPAAFDQDLTVMEAGAKQRALFNELCGGNANSPNGAPVALALDGMQAFQDTSHCPGNEWLQFIGYSETKSELKASFWTIINPFGQSGRSYTPQCLNFAQGQWQDIACFDAQKKPTDGSIWTSNGSGEGITHVVSEANHKGLDIQEMDILTIKACVGTECKQIEHYVHDESWWKFWKSNVNEIEAITQDSDRDQTIELSGKLFAKEHLSGGKFYLSMLDEITKCLRVDQNNTIGFADCPDFGSGIHPEYEFSLSEAEGCLHHAGGTPGCSANVHTDHGHTRSMTLKAEASQLGLVRIDASGLRSKYWFVNHCHRTPSDEMFTMPLADFMAVSDKSQFLGGYDCSLSQDFAIQMTKDHSHAAHPVLMAFEEGAIGMFHVAETVALFVVTEGAGAFVAGFMEEMAAGTRLLSTVVQGTTTVVQSAWRGFMIITGAKAIIDGTYDIIRCASDHDKLGTTENELCLVDGTVNVGVGMVMTAWPYLKAKITGNMPNNPAIREALTRSYEKSLEQPVADILDKSLKDAGVPQNQRIALVNKYGQGMDLVRFGTEYPELAEKIARDPSLNAAGRRHATVLKNFIRNRFQVRKAETFTKEYQRLASDVNTGADLEKLTQLVESCQSEGCLVGKTLRDTISEPSTPAEEGPLCLSGCSPFQVTTVPMEEARRLLRDDPGFDFIAAKAVLNSIGLEPLTQGTMMEARGPSNNRLALAHITEPNLGTKLATIMISKATQIPTLDALETIIHQVQKTQGTSGNRVKFRFAVGSKLVGTILEVKTSFGLTDGQVGSMFNETSFQTADPQRPTEPFTMKVLETKENWRPGQQESNLEFFPQHPEEEAEALRERLRVLMRDFSEPCSI